MIGVVSQKNQEVVEEFFQLFKTPWEYYEPGKSYEVLIASPLEIPETDSPLVIIYGPEACLFDRGVGVEKNSGGFFLEWEGSRVPIYENASTFTGTAHPFLNSQRPGQAAGYEIVRGKQKVLRVGFDLFLEVRYLLTQGQPTKNALIPTLDLHIEMLRTWISDAGIELIEIPPVPYGYQFTVCLTHDVDFIGIRYHLGDHSMWGFLYRASLGSLLKYLKGKIDLKKLTLNFKSVFNLPFVYLGLGRDPWDQFDRYLEIEKGLGATYFFIPFKNRPGEGYEKKKDRYRAAKYDVDDIDAILPKLIDRGCEVGVHGLDAWHSVEKGQEELQRVREKTGSPDGIGIRMHWLAGNERTPETLDKAGFSYDSTVGYNETVGFKAGTSQVFQPIGAKNLLEIPLIIQDSALFGEERMNVTDTQADSFCEQIIDTVNRVKGVLTILWHQRSLGPERLWGDFYVKLLKKLKESQVWFATAKEITEWSRLRRAARFEQGDLGGIATQNSTDKSLPPLSVRISGRGKSGDSEYYNLDAFLKHAKASMLKNDNH